MQLKHEILSEELVKDKIVGMSIIMISDVVEELKGDPDFDNEAYKSILTAELQTLHKEMKDTCRVCQQEDERVCCESGCKLFEKGVEYLEIVNSDYDICYHCPEKDTGCLGYEYCTFRNVAPEKVKDVSLLADDLYRRDVISEDKYKVLVDNGLRSITSDDYKQVLELLGSKLTSKIQQEFFVLIDKNFAFYLPGLRNVLGDSETKSTKEIPEFEKSFNKYMEGKESKTVTAASDKYKVLIKRSHANGSYFGTIIKDNRKVAKFIIRKDYISSQIKLSDKMLSSIVKKIHSDFDENFQIPSKVYKF